MRWRWPAALAVNKPAVLFFTMAGIRALTGPPPALDDWGRDALNRERGVGDFETLLQACVELGARFIVCEMGLRSLAIDRAELARRRSLHDRRDRDLAGRDQAGHASCFTVGPPGRAHDIRRLRRAGNRQRHRRRHLPRRRRLPRPARPGDQGQHDADRRGARRDALRRDGAGHRGLRRLVRQHHGGRRLVRRQGRLYRQGARRPAGRGVRPRPQGDRRVVRRRRRTPARDRALPDPGDARRAAHHEHLSRRLHRPRPGRHRHRARGLRRR